MDTLIREGKVYFSGPYIIVDVKAAGIDIGAHDIIHHVDMEFYARAHEDFAIWDHEKEVPLDNIQYVIPEN